MTQAKTISRRAFVGSAFSTATASCLPNAALLADISGRKVAAAEPRQQSALGPSGDPSWKNQGIENLSKSPFAKLRDVPVRAVTINEGFWAARRDTNVNKSIPSMHDLLEAHGRMNNFRRLTGKSTAAQIGPVYSDSDVYKWTEAVGFASQSADHPELRSTADKIIDDVVTAQQPNGYLNTYYVGDRASQSMLPQIQTTGHELYNMGHMLQGAIAYYRATGETKMLDAGIRFVNNFLLPNYGPAPLKPIVSGHPEIEMSLIELYRVTGDKRQLDLAGYILQGDDRIPLRSQQIVYMFCGIPFMTRTKIEGHAARSMYACCGATDYFLETGDSAYWKTLNTLWDDMTGSKMYVTGGVGSRAAGEAFGEAYELPNYSAYGESCAAIGNMMWNWRMLAASGDAKFTDVIERALYNGINSGMSLNGTLYCYRNPLAFDPASGESIRNPWYDTTCCPPNLERTFAALPGYFYSTSSDGAYLHLFDNSELDWHLENGTPLKITQKTNYPWEGVVEVTVSPAEASDFALYLRIPAWAGRAQVAVNGKPVAGVRPGEYLPIRRLWSPGDVIGLQMEMAASAIEANSHIVEGLGRVAIQRGPLIYCMEQLDQHTGDDFSAYAVNTGQKSPAQFHSEFKSDVLDGVVIIEHMGAAYQNRSSQLYSHYDPEPVKTQPALLTLIPYYAWSNRAQTPMQVWTPYLKA